MGTKNIDKEPFLGHLFYCLAYIPDYFLYIVYIFFGNENIFQTNYMNFHFFEIKHFYLFFSLDFIYF